MVVGGRTHVAVVDTHTRREYAIVAPLCVKKERYINSVVIESLESARHTTLYAI